MSETGKQGKVPDQWHVAPLGTFVSRVTYGFTNPMPTMDSGPFMVTAKDVHDGRIDYSSARHTSWDAYRTELTDKSRPRVGDVLLTKDGSIGRIAICDRPDVCINQPVALIQPRDRIDSRFLKYLLETPRYQNRMEADSDGTTIKHIYITRVDKMHVAVPPIQEQRAIVGILGALDDKIELNRRTNETLEAIARAIFKSWFVDFDPVRAKAEGRQPAGMDAETAALFPGSFQGSDLGDVPTGWRWAPLSEAAELNPTRRLGKGIDAPYVEMASLPTRGHRPSGWPRREAGSGARFQNGDTLLARITPCRENGKTGYVDFLDEFAVGWGSTEYIVIHPRAPLPPEWAYLLARDEAFRDFAVQKMDGTTGRQRVPADSLGRYLVAIPAKPVGEAFGRLVSPLSRKMGAADDECRTLAALRDALLPKLLSGEIRVDQGMSA